MSTHVKCCHLSTITARFVNLDVFCGFVNFYVFLNNYTHAQNSDYIKIIIRYQLIVFTENKQPEELIKYIFHCKYNIWIYVNIRM